MRISPAILAIMTAALCGCAEGNGSEDCKAPDPAAALPGKYNGFGLELFGVLAGGAESNLFISPASVSICMGMVLNGADGETASEIEELLRVPGMGLESFNRANDTLLAGLDESAGGSLSIANSIWLQESFPFEDGFAARNREHFDAGVMPLSTAGAINSWVEEKTKGMIDRIIDSLHPRDIAVLINAIHFKGTWLVEFDPERTGKKDFHGLSGTTAVDMMSRAGEFDYLEEKGLFQAVRLPYEEGSIAMYVLLPEEGTGRDSLLAVLDPERWDAWTGSFERRKGHLEMPRFRMEYFKLLNGPLQEMGMRQAFGAGADFSRMCECGPGDVYISRVLHKAVVEVDEKGTEAAAVTAVQVRVTSAMPSGPEPFRMIVDRPFLFAIVDEDSGLILFAGMLVDPE